eukprot:scaffold105416_cov22-Prasinocladus_malaysianus.AAC.1
MSSPKSYTISEVPSECPVDNSKALPACCQPLPYRQPTTLKRSAVLARIDETADTDEIIVGTEQCNILRFPAGEEVGTITARKAMEAAMEAQGIHIIPQPPQEDDPPADMKPL